MASLPSTVFLVVFCNLCSRSINQVTLSVDLVSQQRAEGHFYTSVKLQYYEDIWFTYIYFISITTSWRWWIFSSMPISIWEMCCVQLDRSSMLTCFAHWCTWVLLNLQCWTWMVEAFLQQMPETGSQSHLVKRLLEQRQSVTLLFLRFRVHLLF